MRATAAAPPGSRRSLRPGLRPDSRELPAGRALPHVMPAAPDAAPAVAPRTRRPSASLSHKSHGGPGRVRARSASEEGDFYTHVDVICGKSAGNAVVLTSAREVPQRRVPQQEASETRAASDRHLRVPGCVPADDGGISVYPGPLRTDHDLRRRGRGRGHPRDPAQPDRRHHRRGGRQRRRQLHRLGGRAATAASPRCAAGAAGSGSATTNSTAPAPGSPATAPGPS